MATTIITGSTSNRLRFLLGVTGLTNSTTGLIISTITDNEATATVYTAAASNIETITTLGTYAAPTSGKCRFKEVDATNHPGLYEIQLADARFSVSNASRLVISVSGAAGLPSMGVHYEIDLLAHANVRAWLGVTPAALSNTYVQTRVLEMANDVVTAAAIATDAIGSDELAASAANEIADAVLSRNVSNVEATAPEHSLCTVALAMLENTISGTTLTIRRTDGSTTHYTKTLTTSAGADPITGIQ